jgi:hypothetical protein
MLQEIVKYFSSKWKKSSSFSNFSFHKIVLNLSHLFLKKFDLLYFGTRFSIWSEWMLIKISDGLAVSEFGALEYNCSVPKPEKNRLIPNFAKILASLKLWRHILKDSDLKQDVFEPTDASDPDGFGVSHFPDTGERDVPRNIDLFAIRTPHATVAREHFIEFSRCGIFTE